MVGAAAGMVSSAGGLRAGMCGGATSTSGGAVRRPTGVRGGRGAVGALRAVLKVGGSTEQVDVGSIKCAPGSVLVQLVKADTLTEGGIVLTNPEEENEPIRLGSVLAASADAVESVPVGAKVIVPTWLGIEAKVDGNVAYFIPAEELYASFE